VRCVVVASEGTGRTLGGRVSVLRGGRARAVSRTVRSIASGRSGTRVSGWLRGGPWPGSIIWRLTAHRCPGFLGASSAPKRRPPSSVAALSAHSVAASCARSDKCKLWVCSPTSPSARWTLLAGGAEDGLAAAKLGS